MWLIVRKEIVNYWKISMDRLRIQFSEVGVMFLGGKECERVSQGALKKRQIKASWIVCL